MQYILKHWPYEDGWRLVNFIPRTHTHTHTHTHRWLYLLSCNSHENNVGSRIFTVYPEDPKVNSHCILTNTEIKKKWKLFKNSCTMLWKMCSLSSRTFAIDSTITCNFKQFVLSPSPYLSLSLSLSISLSLSLCLSLSENGKPKILFII